MYSIQIDHVTYDSYKDGAAFTLADCWRELEGTGNARILCGDRVVLNNAGAASMRRQIVRRAYWDMKHKY